MILESPWALTLIVVVAALPLLSGLITRLVGVVGVRFPSTTAPSQVRPTLRTRARWLPAALRMAALAFLVTAVARPRLGLERVVDISKGVAIEMVIDRSGSMAAPIDIGGWQVSRLDAVKEVAARFVHGDRADLQGRPNDLIGMVTFARFPSTIAPLTRSHDAIRGFLSAQEVVTDEAEDGTAIGDAVALAAARLQNAERELGARDDYEIKSKVVILLTDGRNNAGERSPEEAAELARGWGIKIYTIGIGVGAQESLRSPFGLFRLPAGSSVDEASLQSLADTTGGIYRTAADGDALLGVYREIDRLERSEVESVRYESFRERFPPIALTALLIAVAVAVLDATAFRRSP